jgi:hypothetical protein
LIMREAMCEKQANFAGVETATAKTRSTQWKNGKFS